MKAFGVTPWVSVKVLNETVQRDFCQRSMHAFLFLDVFPYITLFGGCYATEIFCVIQVCALTRLQATLPKAILMHLVFIVRLA